MSRGWIVTAFAGCVLIDVGDSRGFIFIGAAVVVALHYVVEAWRMASPQTKDETR